jgi:hypothetical protein
VSTLVLASEPAVVNIAVDDRRLIVDLADGRALSIPVDWYPRLLHATPAERSNWQILGDGYAVEWPELDEHIGVEGLLAGRRSGEGDASLQRWLAARR